MSLFKLSAVDVVKFLKEGKYTCEEVIKSFIEQINYLKVSRARLRKDLRKVYLKMNRKVHARFLREARATPAQGLRKARARPAQGRPCAGLVRALRGPCADLA